MTNAEAIKILKGAIKKPNTEDGYMGQALTMAIKALEQQTCTREDFIQYAKEHYGIDIEFKDSDKPDTFNGLFGVEVYEDAVSRQAVLGLFAQNADAVRPYSKTWEEVKALPSVNPQPICEEREKGECPYYAG